MSVAVIDAREWQNQFDLESGRKVENPSALTRMAGRVLSRHPYPGDVAQHSNRWVSDTALDLITHYDPRLVCLIYAYQYFAGRFSPLEPQQWEQMVAEVFTEVRRFIDASGYRPVIVGTGEMTPLRGELDLSKLDGLAICSSWSVRYAGLHHPSRRDLDHLAGLPQIERLVPLQEWIDLFGCGPDTLDRMPQYLAVSRRGWGYKVGGTPLRKSHLVPAPTPLIPIATPLEPVNGLRDITDIRPWLQDQLARQKIALIVLEGLGAKDFPVLHALCRNGRSWFNYEPGEGQYLTLASGRHQLFTYPAGYPLYEDDGEDKAYPFSGYFKQIPPDTIGSAFEGRSIAVGNRSMLTHMVFGGDVCIECFARNLFNQGCMAAVHRHDKLQPQSRANP
jgi:hypothetical protein